MEYFESAGPRQTPLILHVYAGSRTFPMRAARLGMARRKAKLKRQKAKVMKG
jgi:hypothetical protein